ncbi:MAG: LysR family transcriptional regulator [Mediterraneibacter faecis]
MPLLGIAITWSALNQQLLKLEKELGTPLFYRSRTDWHPTPAGEIYLNAENLYHPGER